MLELHLETSEAGGIFRARTSADEVRAAVESCVWDPAAIAPAPDEGWRPSPANLLMFLSDVRTRRFRAGLFLADDVLAAAETFRLAARWISAGHVLPTLEGTYARWRPEGGPADPFFRWCVDALMRRAGRGVLEGRSRTVGETVHEAWLAALRDEEGLLVWPDRAAVEALAASLATWRAPLTVSAADRAALCFTLVPPRDEDGPWRITYPAPRTRLGYISLGQAARLFPPLRHAEISRADAESFLRAGASLLTAAGYTVQVPPALAGEHVSAALDLETPETETSASARPVRTHLTIHVDGEVVTEAEIEFLLEQGSSLVFFRNRWIEVDRNVLKEALRALQAVKGRDVSVRDAVSFATGARRFGRLEIAAVKAQGWLRGLLNTLRGHEKFALLPVPAALHATLRDYQVRGFSWIAFLARWGFGACLADDMGLGKTVQAIAWILHFRADPTVRRASARGPVLVVAPVSVTTNWMREFARFAPSLKVYLHQGPERDRGLGFRRRCRTADVIVSGYTLLVKDFRDFADASFSALVLDEAQMVKNADTRAARAVCALAAPVRVALTGTPLENSAADLWSLEEFLNPGLLGERRDFQEAFVRPIRQDAHTPAAAKLRRVLEPFMLRRLKTDPGVAEELGAKREIREYCPLSLAQRRAYEDALAAYRADQEATRGQAGRNGRILALLTELKLVCDGAGKLRRLVELLGDIFANGEHALVFTQYAKIGRLIRDHLAEEFGRRFPFLHGGLNPVERESEIAAFNAAPEPGAFILSLKAGGFGLNLTRATHVIHFDRWWNPAVENQATDRAHRIGQSRTVFVHTFICTGTLEDRIDELLESKRRLSGELVGTGESFLLKMSDRELETIVSLAP